MAQTLKTKFIDMAGLTLIVGGIRVASKPGQIGTALEGTSGDFSTAGKIVSSSPSAGVGYATGAGGAVTQGTSRATGVTLNKVTGQVTLFAAAPSTTATTFTLTNSAIGATDVVVVSISGNNAANTYFSSAHSVAAGSCKISVYSAAGTTSDSAVVNFTVIKGVAA